MNKPYTCHNCGTVVEAYPDLIKTQRERLPLELRKPHLRIKCPGCEAEGKPPHERIYTLDITGDEPVLVDSPWKKVS